MEPILIETSLKTYSDNANIVTKYKGVKNNNKIFYEDNGILVEIELLEHELHMNRRCDDYSLELCFCLNEKTKGLYVMTENGFEIEYSISTSILNLGNNIELEYHLKCGDEDLDTYYFNLKYEVNE